MGKRNWELGIGNWENFTISIKFVKSFFEILEDFIPIRFREENVIIGITSDPTPRSQVVPGNA